MILTFHIDYYTRYDERLQLQITGGDKRLHFPAWVDMSKCGNSSWSATLELPDSINEIEYRYLLVDPSGKILRKEYGMPHKAVKNGTVSHSHFYDLWQDRPWDKPFRSSLFRNVTNRRHAPQRQFTALSGHLALSVVATDIKPTETVAICGSSKALGEWNPTKALRMNDSEFPYWIAEFPFTSQRETIEYKFVIINLNSGEVVSWEEGANRCIEGISGAHGSYIYIDCGSIDFKRGIRKGAGTAIPLFSIRTKNDMGVGDFVEMRKAIDWCSLTRQNILQILPVNDTTMTGSWHDSYPYNANSTYALHPIYIGIGELGELSDKILQSNLIRQAQKLNALAELDYEKVCKLKERYTRALYEQDGITTLESDKYKEWFIANKDWLVPYAVYRSLMRSHNNSDPSTWGEMAVYNEDKATRYFHEQRKETGYHCYIQYHLAAQLTRTLEYAHTKGVAIKGDIPIGIASNSVDAWVNPKLYNLGCQAGAPPDAFATEGQNWGFPTYNWEAMSKDGYSWWKSRLGKMSEYFDAYRIDHVLGFFRIWEIPCGALHGLLGYFNPALPLTPLEMKESFGFKPFPHLLAIPHITRNMAADAFGDECDNIINLYFEEDKNGNLSFKPDFDTQLKIRDNVEDKKVCGKLMKFLDNVLFIKDPYSDNRWHPRIDAQKTELYTTLSENERIAYDNLYYNFFYVRHNDFWRTKAMEKLPTLTDSTGMLACAEDLGMIPASVAPTLKQLRVLTLEIERMPKEYGVEKGDPAKYPYLSVCSTSTHDMPGIREHYESINGEGTATPEICTRIIKRNLAANSMLCILPLQDWLSTDGNLRRDDAHAEQINDPSDPNNNWSYRMHLNMEDLIEAERFNRHITDWISESGRNTLDL